MTHEPTQSVFELVLARPVDRPGGVDPGLVHLWWSAPAQGDRLVQVYVNGRLHDVTLDPDQRAMWLLLDRRLAHRIELLAVDVNDPEGVWQGRPERLQSWSPTVHAEASVALLRDHALPIDTRIEVNVDGEVLDRGALWPADIPRGGFGALFGEGAFGLDAAAGPGLGGGELGHGPLGSDGTAWRWRREDLPPGEHLMTLQASDSSGQPISDPFNKTVAIDELPAPAETLTVSDDFTLKWR